jgi:hypothetical protein
MKVAFLSNKLTLRGTEVAIYEYAHYNETILGNVSVIITRDIKKLTGAMDIHQEAYDKFHARFPVIYYDTPADLDSIITNEKIDLLFVEKAGSSEDKLITSKCKNLIHCVFNTEDKHGDLFTSTSDFVNVINKTNYPVINFIVKVHPASGNLRKELNIPEDATVFGTYSGADCFNIDYIRKAVEDIANDPSHKNIYFIFLNVNPFGKPCERMIFLPGTANMELKRKFIDTCDAMNYGRDGGETFGIACGEFSLCNKLVIGRRYERCYSHITFLGDNMIKHDNYNELYTILTEWSRFKKDVTNNKYEQFSPEYVMGEFKHCLGLLGFS